MKQIIKSLLFALAFAVVVVMGTYGILAITSDPMEAVLIGMAGVVVVMLVACLTIKKEERR